MPITTLKRLVAWRPGRLARNTSHAGVWNLARIVFQAITLVLMARHFGAMGYGSLAGVIALFVTLAQLVGLGSGIALVRHLSRVNDEFGRLKTTQRLYALSGLALLVVTWPLSMAYFDQVLSPLAFACLAIAELVIAPTLLPLVYKYQAEERLFLSGTLLTVGPLARLLAAALAILMETKNLTTFSIYYLSTFSVSVLAVLILTRQKAPITMKSSSLVEIALEGLPYMVSSASTTAANELDKSVLLRLSGGEIAGQYAAAYRVVMAASLPVNSLILAAAPRMFRDQAGSSSELSRTLLVVTLVYAALASLAMAVLAPLIPRLLGGEFNQSVPFMRWLCLILITGCVRQLVTAQLTTSDQQYARNIIEICGLVLSLLLLALIVPRLGAYGAMIAVGMGDCLVIAAGYLSMRRARHREQEI